MCPCRTTAEVVAALCSVAGHVVLCVEGLEESKELVKAASRVPGKVIQVKLEGWDGAGNSPVAVAATGVVAGFGIAGVEAAVAFLGKGS
ncbi:MAG TPA: hypothetical protein DGL25_04445 [Dehalococcoidia bacterium]|nr:hypothetical protein [Dehalococcoidia bacterium]